MNAKDRRPAHTALLLLFGIVPLAIVLVLGGCRAKTGDEATDSLNVTTEVPAPAAPAGGATRFVESSNGQEVVVAPGSEFEVALLSDPTSGMDWVWVDSTSSSIVLVDYSIVLQGTDGTISPNGATVWRFRAPTTGSSPIHLELRKPGETAAARTYTITVKPE